MLELVKLQFEQQRRNEEKQLELQQKHAEQQRRNEEQQRRNDEKQLELQRQMIEQQKRFEELLLQTRSINTESETTFSQNAIWSAIDNFTYSPDEDKTFASYFRRYEDLFEIEIE